MNSDHAGNGFEVDLLWYKDAKGYALEDQEKWIVRRGGELVPIHPLRGDFAFKVFSNVSTPKDLVKFMNCYGFLESVDSLGSSILTPSKSGKSFAIRAHGPKGENVREHLESAGFFREIIGAKPRRRLSKGAAPWVENLGRDGIGEIQMLFDKHGALRPVLKPTSLISGLFWQLINSKRAGAQYRTCQYCAVIFQVGVGSGRRADAKFCSDEHKKEFNSRKRSVR
jgi:hypothetical protein